MLQVLGDGTLFKRMFKFVSLAHQKNMGSFTQRFSVKEKGKTQIHLIEPMCERWEKVLMGLQMNFKIPKDVIDVMAQIKWLVEDTIHHNTNITRFQEMAKTPKEMKKHWRWRFGFQEFPISRNSGPYLVLKDVGSQKVDIIIKQLLLMVSSTRKELRKGLLIPKVPKVPHLWMPSNWMWM